MSTESLNRLSDIELHKRLIDSGFPNIPVTETTRALLIKKLKTHAKTEKLLKRKKVNNFVLYSKDNQDPYAQTTANLSVPGSSSDNNNDIKLSRNNQGSFYNHHYMDESDTNIPHNMITTPSSASRMYAPPPVLASNYDNDNECEPPPHTLNNMSNKYRKPCSMPCSSSNPGSPSVSVDAPGPYVSKPSNGKPNLSEGGVVNRLLSFRDSTIQRKFGYSVHVAKLPAPARNGGNNIKRFMISDLKAFFRKPDSSQYIIPQVLIALFIIFLSIITVLYVAKKFDKSPIDRAAVNFKLCSNNNEGIQLSTANEKVTCLGNELLTSALAFSEVLFQELNERAQRFHCQHEDLSPTIEVNEFVREITSRGKMAKSNVQSNLLASTYLISQNPQWMIRMTDSDQTSFELIQPSLPLKCIIVKKITRFFTVFGLIILVVLGLLLVYFAIAFYRARQRESLCAAEQLTKDIINELVYQSSISETPEIIVSQLQEKLIPPNRRSRLLSAWNRAIKMLETTDNRVHFGLILRDGKQLRTIAWSRKVDKKNFGTVKKWQSPAFDNSNKIANPPTPCLKIRHMFDASEVEQPNLKQLIVESIFEKVGPRCKICDVQLDTQSCCVYIRCASEADAGMIHNEINGWWFDKRLISIKFLRLERYLCRFPKPSGEPLL
ncbi:uncharacterized protein Dwil_GK21928 [Drosophila willistoni]|uniref:GK21928 n=1 Tax=Drosophila willistoni TaxID=7260 RepID=B4MQS3_DROWI|nr:inner nuclear membrane protein Man1 [Drosophila willistoni]XP_046866073.1 inner nuclear membrane protein Man1 [Drosophila willistoni]EDW74462.1 uncharacterized protein Dwil_GK21928 [Drosophila willistoni]